MTPALALLVSLASLAAEERVRLTVARDEAAAACPDTSALAARVRARIGSEPFTDAADARHVDVTLEAESRGLVARVRLTSKDGVMSGERTLRGASDCAELADALALAVAIAIDPLLLLRAPRRDDGALPVEGEDEAPPRPPAPDTRPDFARAPDLGPKPSDTIVGGRPRAQRERPLGFAPRVVALATGGVASPLAPGGRLGVLWQGELVTLDAGVRAALPARLVLGDVAGPVDLTLTALSFSPGVALVGEVASLRGGALVDAGALQVRGVGLFDAREVTVPWLALGVRGGMDIVLTDALALVIDVDLLYPVLRPRFVDTRTGTVFSQTEGLAWVGGVGLAWYL